MWTMARLTQAYHPDDESYVNIGRRHLPFVAGENIMMLVDLNSRGLVIDSPKIKGRELEVFNRKFNLLTPEELRKSLEINESELISVLNQCVQCVGCRRRVERLFYQLTDSGHPTLYPLVFSKTCTVTINEDKLKTPQALGTLLYRHHENLNTILEKKLRTKTRCVLHSLDAFRSKPFSETWREVWSAMNHNCRDELAVIETFALHEVLENYLKKHKFCTGCKAKIEKAYKILIGTNTTKEKGYVASLYSNIKKCQSENHVHVATNKIDFLDALIRRAEPEVNGSYSKLRERHAKTLEIAQEEVLTCVGMIMYERLRRIYVSSREEEHACQVLAAVSVHALSRSFDTFVENKQGISNLELLYHEMSKAEKAKELKREQKKLKKKLKKNEKKSKLSCSSPSEQLEADLDAEADGDADNESDAGFHQDDDSSARDNSSPVRDHYEHDHDQDHDQLDPDNLNEVAKETCEPEEEEEQHPCKAVQCQANSKSDNVNNVKNSKNEKKKKLKQKQKQKQKSKQKRNKNNKGSASGSESLSEGAKDQNQKSKQEYPTNVFESISDDENCLGAEDEEEEEHLNEKCSECMSPGNDCPCENDVKDSGYGSEIYINSPLSSSLNSPEGSEVCCSDGLCNHEANDLDDEPTNDLLADSPDFLNERSSPIFNFNDNSGKSCYSLLELLDEYENVDEDDDFYIPEEVVLEHQRQHDFIEKQRHQLREKLRNDYMNLFQPSCENIISHNAN